jgi:serine/threonine-protein kinase mTOR
MVVNQQHLKQAWDVSQVNSKEDWFEWIRRLAIELMKESPSHAIRACVSLAETHPPLARELFNAAFVSCWTELFEQYQVGHLSCNCFFVSPTSLVVHSRKILFDQLNTH